MQPIGLTLLALGVFAFLLALRGRVVARGRFCRRCRFDLAGLTDPAACPECGRDLARPGATRPSLRRASRAGVAAAALLTLIGAGVSGIAATNNTARVMAALPDGAVMFLADLGVDAALTDLAENRLMRTKPLADAHWDTLIDRALALQADASQPWDPRYGEVLAVALGSGRLTEDQVVRMLTSHTQSTIEIPDSIRHGATDMVIRMTTTEPDRLAALTPVWVLSDGNGKLMSQHGIVRITIDDPAHTIETNVSGLTGFSIPGPDGGRGVGSISSRVELTLDWKAIRPGDELVFTIHAENGLFRLDNEPKQYPQVAHAHRRTVRVLPPEAELVAARADASLIAAFREQDHARVGPIEIRPGPTVQDSVLTWILHDLPVGVSGRVVLIHGGGETPLGWVTWSAQPGYMITSGSLAPDPEAIDQATLAAWLEAGSVTIEIRPDPRHAERTPGMTGILGVPLRFENVPVTDQPVPREVQSSLRHPLHTTGRPVPADAADD